MATKPYTRSNDFSLALVEPQSVTFNGSTTPAKLVSLEDTITKLYTMFRQEYGMTHGQAMLAARENAPYNREYTSTLPEVVVTAEAPKSIPPITINEVKSVPVSSGSTNTPKKKNPGKMIHYDPLEELNMTRAWKYGGWYNGKYIPASSYAKLDDAVGAIIGAPLLALNPVTGMLASAAWDGVAAVGDAALRYGSRQLGKWAGQQAARATGQQAARATGQTAASTLPSTNYMAFLNNGIGQMVPRMLPDGTVILETATSSVLPQIMLSTATVSSPLVGGWSSTSTGGPVQNNNKNPNPKKPKKSVEDRIKELRERWKKMSPITKGTWLVTGAGAGYLGADAYKDFTNTQATPILNGTHQAIPDLSTELYNVDTMPTQSYFQPDSSQVYLGGYEERWDPYEDLY